MEIAACLLVLLALLCWVASWALCARFRTVPAPAPAPAAAAPAPAARISVIIPARDEEDNLGRLLPSLQAGDHAPHEIIVVDDESGDATADRAREHGAVVVPGSPLPEGWLGKPWACQQGAEASSGDWLLFLDADTEMEAGGMARMAALAGDEAHVHSVCPFHRVVAPYEQLSAFFNVIMILGMNAFTLKGESAKNIGLFGQVLLVARRTYDAAGGHAAVKREVLENFHLSRHFAKAGATCHCWLGEGTIRMRMFPGGIRELVAGWSKGFVSGAGNTPAAAMTGISLWLTGLMLTVIALCFVPFVSGPMGAVIGILYVMNVRQLFFLFRKAGSFRLFTALCFPVGLVFYQVVFARALRRRGRGTGIQWKGRHVD